jgi:excisionase family DNA binding protein
MPTIPEARDQLLDVPAVAERLGVRVRFIRRLIAERRIPYIKLGHLVRFDPTEIDAWVDTARVQTDLAGTAPEAASAAKRIDPRSS